MLLQLIEENEEYSPDAGVVIEASTVPSKFFLYKDMVYSVTKFFNLTYEVGEAKNKPSYCVVARPFPGFFTKPDIIDSAGKSQGFPEFNITKL